MALAELAAAIESIKIATDIVKGIKAVNSETEFKIQKSNLLDSMIEVKIVLSDLQDRYDTLRREKDEFEDIIKRFNDWENTSEQYELKEISPGKYGYVFSGDDSEVPLHFLCVNCFEDKSKSIMQLRTNGSNEVIYHCPKCKYVIALDKYILKNKLSQK